MTNETMEQQKATAFVTPTQMRWLTFGFSLVALLSAAFGAGWVSHSVTTPRSLLSAMYQAWLRRCRAICRHKVLAQAGVRKLPTNATRCRPTRSGLIVRVCARRAI
jgi:hypothetical protein